jgi:hypothetical protein
MTLGIQLSSRQGEPREAIDQSSKVLPEIRDSRSVHSLLTVAEVETSERGTSGQKEPLLLPEEGLEHLTLKRTEPARLQGGAIPATGGAELPECPPSPEVRGELRPETGNLRRGGESPDVGVAGLAKNLRQEARSFRWGSGAEARPELGDRHGFVPQKVGNSGRVVEIARQRCVLALQCHRFPARAPRATAPNVARVLSMPGPTHLGLTKSVLPTTIDIDRRGC